MSTSAHHVGYRLWTNPFQAICLHWGYHGFRGRSADWFLHHITLFIPECSEGTAGIVTVGSETFKAHMEENEVLTILLLKGI